LRCEFNQSDYDKYKEIHTMQILGGIFILQHDTSTGRMQPVVAFTILSSEALK